MNRVSCSGGVLRDRELVCSLRARFHGYACARFPGRGTRESPREAQDEAVATVGRIGPGTLRCPEIVDGARRTARADGQATRAAALDHTTRARAGSSGVNAKETRWITSKSAHHSSTFPSMSYRPQSLGFFWPTGCGDPPELFWYQAISPKSPYLAPSVPARHAYSHSASVGSRNPLPGTSVFNFVMNSWQSFQDTCSTGTLPCRSLNSEGLPRITASHWTRVTGYLPI